MAAYETAYLTLTVADLDRSVRFYTETLGLPLGERFGDHWASVSAPGVQIGLHPAGDQPAQAGQGDAISLGLMVADFDRAVSELERQGVRFEQVTRGEGASSAYFRDPDGTSLYLMQRTRRGKD